MAPPEPTPRRWDSRRWRACWSNRSTRKKRRTRPCPSWPKGGSITWPRSGKRKGKTRRLAPAAMGGLARVGVPPVARAAAVDDHSRLGPEDEARAGGNDRPIGDGQDPRGPGRFLIVLMPGHP